MYPTLFRIGHFSLSTYGLIVAIAALAAGWIAARGFRERGRDEDEAWALWTYALVSGFVGARLYYVALHGDLSELFARGGFVWYGGLIGGAVTVAFVARRRRLPLRVAADAFAPALALGHAIGHIGCFFSGDSYGLPSTLPWAVAFPHGAPPSTAGALRQEFGIALPANIPDAALIRVHPTMLYSALTLLIIFTLLWWYRRRVKRPGRLFGLYLVLAGAERFFVEFLRAKDDRFLWGLTTAQAIAAAAIIGGLALCLVLRREQLGPALPKATNPLPRTQGG